MSKKLQLTALSILLMSSVARAQNVEVTSEVDTHQTTVGGRIMLQVAVRGDINQAQEPRFPGLEAFTVQQAGVSSQFQMINGRSSSASIYTYVLTPIRAGHFIIPPLTVEVGGQTYHTNQLEVDVASAGAAPNNNNAGYQSGNYPRARRRGGFPGQPDPWGGPPSMPPGYDPQPAPAPVEPPRAKGPMVLVEAEASPRNPYVNQAVTYKFRLLHRVNLDGNPNFEAPNTTGFLHEQLGQKTYQVERNGVYYSVSEATIVFFPTAAGDFSLGPTRLTCRLAIDDLTDIDNFTAMMDNVRELVAEAINIHVKPLPTTGRPSDFSGGVGNFSMKANLDKSQGQQGQPLTLTVEVSGDGHPDLVTEPSIPDNDNFKFYKSKSDSKIEHAANEFHGTKTFQIPVVPLKSGHLEIPPLSLSYFDPRENRYETVTTKPIAVDVKPGVMPSATPSPGSTPAPEAHEEKTLRGLKPLSDLRGPSRDLPLWVWALQLLPWLALLAHRTRRSIGGWLSERSRAQASSSLGKRTRAEIHKLPDDRVDDAAALIYSYLEARLAAPVSGYSLQELSQHLQGRGVAAPLSRDLTVLLGDLEAFRYAPKVGSASTLAGELRERSEELVTGLDQSLR